jgi:hypothetical protein
LSTSANRCSAIIQAVEAACHCDAHRVEAGKQSFRQALALSAEPQRRAPAPFDLAQVSFASWREAVKIEAAPRHRIDEPIGIVRCRKRNLEHGADRNPDRLAVERIAGTGIEDHRIGSERRRVAEYRADIVVIGDADQHDDQRPLGQ